MVHDARDQKCKERGKRDHNGKFCGRHVPGHGELQAEWDIHQKRAAKAIGNNALVNRGNAAAGDNDPQHDGANRKARHDHRMRHWHLYVRKMLVHRGADGPEHAQKQERYKMVGRFHRMALS